jgi:hypothetical protein
MLAEKKLNTNLGVGIGLVISIAQVFLVRSHILPPVLGHIMAWIGLGILVWGCMNYAEGKGHSKWFGLLGILSCIGLLILVLMPDLNKEPKSH